MKVTMRRKVAKRMKSNSNTNMKKYSGGRKMVKGKHAGVHTINMTMAKRRTGR